ncbi:PTS ascorbate transporter subunit IIC, partial [Listeria monocytogenes]|nr:PTS ascorbate transporter subunit IIC [Listeria monocytogenes]
LARFTPFKYIYLPGHMMFWTTTIFAGITVQAVGGDMPFWGLVLFLAVIMGLYWTFQPANTQPFLRKITGNHNVALGHTSSRV